MTSPLRLIVGLGNPGKDYARTRHNAGFWFADELAAKHGGSFRTESKFRGELAQVRIENESLFVFKPSTYMNNSGEAVQVLTAFHKIAAEQILVVHDELDLPVGAARLKIAGGHGGHNGLRSLHQHLGEAYLRLRLGVGHPGTKERVHGYLTEERAPAIEEKLIRTGIAAGLEALHALVTGGIEKAMQFLHSRLPPLASHLTE